MSLLTRIGTPLAQWARNALGAAPDDSPRAPSPNLQKYIDQDARQMVELYAESLTKSDGTNGPIHTSRFITEATKAFPADGIMGRDGGATVIFGWTYNMCKPRDVIWNQNYGHIGTGLPYIVGAMVADKAATGTSSIRRRASCRRSCF